MANAHIRAHHEELRKLRQQKAPELVEVIETLLYRLFSVAFDSKKLNHAALSQVVTSIGVLVDRFQLLSGGATARVEERAIDPAILDCLTPQEKEMMARIREKLAGERPA